MEYRGPSQKIALHNFQAAGPPLCTARGAPLKCRNCVRRPPKRPARHLVKGVEPIKCFAMVLNFTGVPLKCPQCHCTKRAGQSRGRICTARYLAVPVYASMICSPSLGCSMMKVGTPQQVERKCNAKQPRPASFDHKIACKYRQSMHA